jgi:hypothetical protein
MIVDKPGGECCGLGPGSPMRSFEMRLVSAVVGSLVVSLAGVAGADVTFSYSGTSLEYYDAIEDRYVEYDLPAPTVRHETGLNSITMFGNGETDDLENNRITSLLAEDYRGDRSDNGRGSRIVMRGSATLSEPWDSAVLSIPTTFAFGFSFGSGELALFNVGTSFTLFNAQGDGIQGVGSGFGDDGLGTFQPGGYGYGFQFVDRFNGDATAGVRFEWEVVFGFEWTGRNEGDVLAFNTGPEGINIAVVPAPAGLGLLAVGGLVASRRRR